MSTPINTNFPAALQATSATVANHSLSLQSEPGTDHSVSQEHGDDAPSNSSLSQESDDEPAVDINKCPEIYYHQDGDTRGVKYVCEGRESWTPVVGKRRKYRVPTHLLRLKAPPHVRATLPSSGSDSDSDSGSDCFLHIPPGADVQYSVCGGKPGQKVLSNSTSTWTPVVRPAVLNIYKRCRYRKCI